MGKSFLRKHWERKEKFDSNKWEECTNCFSSTSCLKTTILFLKLWWQNVNREAVKWWVKFPLYLKAITVEDFNPAASQVLPVFSIPNLVDNAWSISYASTKETSGWSIKILITSVRSAIISISIQMGYKWTQSEPIVTYFS